MMHMHVFEAINRSLQDIMAADATRQQAFADYLQRVGEGADRVYPSVGEDSILIPHDMCCNGPTVTDLIEE
ncbi:unnamed protein product, partial [Sphagnum jensenii]